MSATTRPASRAQPKEYGGQLPAADGAERDLLLLVQANADMLYELLDARVLRADDFAQPQRADLWRCVEWAMAQDRGFDLQLVYDEWQRRAADRYPAGTFSDLTTFAPALGTNEVPIHAHSWRALAGLVIEAAMRRASLKAFSRIGDEDYSRKGGEVARQEAQAEAQRLIQADYGQRLARLSGEVVERSRGPVPISARALAVKPLARAVALVDGLVVEGSTLFAGKPKTHKSWLFLDLARALASEKGRLFGQLAVERSGRVLLLALEDSEASMQERLQLQGEELPEGLDILTMDADPPLGRWNEGGREWLERYCEEQHPVAIFVDVVQKIRPRRQRGEDWYQVDHDFAAELTTFAHRHHLALWGAHHCNKASREDPLDEVSGTTGFTGGFDNVLAIRRLPAGQQQASHTIYGRGRRLRELEWGLRFDPDLCLWTTEGGLEDSLMGAERARIVALLRQSGPLMPQAIAERLGKNPSTTRTLIEKMTQQGTLVHTTAGYEVFHRTTSDDCKPVDAVDSIDNQQSTASTLSMGLQRMPHVASAGRNDGSLNGKEEPCAPRVPVVPGSEEGEEVREWRS